MPIAYSAINREALSKQIADAIRDAILGGELLVSERLPSEHELADRFGVSRPTVREALKRLAAQNLIRTQRGPTGGAFVNRLTLREALDALETTNTLLIGTNDIPFAEAADARFALEAACLPLALQNRNQGHLVSMHTEIAQQRRNALSDEEFCQSDVRFHRALADATANVVLSVQVGAAIQAMQPLMNMITYRVRDRTRIADLHLDLTTALEKRSTRNATRALDSLLAYTKELADARINHG